MNDDVPDTIYDVLRPQVIQCLRVGKKCLVKIYPTQDGEVIEVGGTSSAGGVGVDRMQTRVYYGAPSSSQGPAVQIILGDNTHFLASRKGMVKARSKSFDENGNPSIQVRLLYAIKTGRYDDRIRALEEYPFEHWPGESIGEKLKLMWRIAKSDPIFSDFVGREMISSLRKSGGLSDWCLWESVADAAVTSTKKLARSERNRRTVKNRELLVDSLREEAQRFHGLPAQVHVRDNWGRRGGEGDWKEVRKTFGLDWLPAKTAWVRDWQKPVLARLGGG